MQEGEDALMSAHLVNRTSPCDDVCQNLDANLRLRGSMYPRVPKKTQ